MQKTECSWGPYGMLHDIRVDVCKEGNEAREIPWTELIVIRVSFLERVQSKAIDGQELLDGRDLTDTDYRNQLKVLKSSGK